MDVSLQATPFDRASKHVNGILTMEHEARQAQKPLDWALRHRPWPF